VRVKVSVLGHFGEGANLLNGQTVKTKIITEELRNQLGQDQVIKIDTHGGWKTLLKAPFQVFKALKRSMNVLIFPAHNGLRVYAPLMSLIKPFFKNRKLHYVVIGGWLPEFLIKRKSLAKSLKKFDGIYVETNTMKSALEGQGFENVFVMPNCKKLTILSEDNLVYPTDAPYKLCTFSRVMKEKGIETAINAVRSVNEELGYTAYSLDIYGQIDSSQMEWFEGVKESFPSYVQYKGLVSFEKSVDVIKEYFALLFPTYYEGEGFAGTLIDAFSAGVPVIASDWKYNSELVNEKVGYLYPTKDYGAFVSVLKEVASAPTTLLDRKPYCLMEAEKYRIERAIHVLLEQIERD
jgi:glycosyltransferase involved in cell wall biosynthesis